MHRNATLPVVFSAVVLITASGSGIDWASRVERRFVVPATGLEAVDGSGRSLADVVRSGTAGAAGAGAGTALGIGAFGKVVAYRYHGAAVAVKELQAGADEESIGMLFGFVFAVVVCCFGSAGLKYLRGCWWWWLIGYDRKRGGDDNDDQPRRQRCAGVRLLLRRSRRQGADRDGAVQPRLAASALEGAATVKGVLSPLNGQRHCNASEATS